MAVDDDEGGVTIRFAMSGRDFGTVEERERIAVVQDELIDVLARTAAGLVDGDAFGAGEALVFLVGSDEDRLAAIAGEVLANAGFAAGSWQVLRTSDEDPEPERMDLPPVVFGPTAVPPGWGEQSWYELHLEQGADRRETFRIEPLERVRPGATLRRDAAMASPVVCCLDPAMWPSGHWDAWSVHAVHESYFSLFLPDWLLDAPSDWITSLRQAREQLDRVGVDVRARRRANQCLLDRPTTFVEEVAALVAVAGSVSWWIDDRPSVTTEFTSGRMLIELLRAEAAASTPRQHLIAGLHDSERFPVWNSLELA